MQDRIIWFIWLAILAAVAAVLAVDESRAVFVAATTAHPFLMGMAKIGLLGTMGELLGGRIVTGRWRLRGVRLHQRALVWAFLGAIFTVVFPLFSFGVDGLMEKGLLPGGGASEAVVGFLSAFYKSFFMNIIFGFAFMIFHRVTDTLIDRGELFTIWPVVEVYSGIDWKNMFRVVGAAVLWFWIPAHTFTFMLPPVFRIMSAALLAIALGFILGLAKRLSLKKQSMPSGQAAAA